ncbi:VOC family protein [Gynuella sunshinyii]|uniref:Lactoylglutathione lyase and related lyase n=1 Tax=Gynuella sunshinyii YC6258 TaxID=1445510 RepID=A0A0C5VRK3_9GAMM|nr:VOC family protein [Gynuella sunshinyii]AJQ96028.1 lactoylglutathione lyase and related lyase [Gynuella sunshinyii YC6258]
MISHITLGTNDLEKAAAFYDDLLGAMGASRALERERLVVWKFAGGGAHFSVIKPYDGQQATAGNGTMVALAIEDVATVDKLHAKALALGAVNEGDPGFRSESAYGAYFRDPDGNKLNLYCRVEADV